MMDESHEEYAEILLALNDVLVGHSPVAALAALGSALAFIWQQARSDGCPDEVMHSLIKVITTVVFKDTPK